MNEHLLKLLAAYAMGTAATALLVRIIWLLPVENYAKHLLAWVVPVPVILIVLVMLYYGPESFAGGWRLPETREGLLRVFLAGALSTFGIYASVPLAKYLYHRLTGSDLAEGDRDEG